MNIYQDPERYAKEAHLPLELAQIRCVEYLPLIEKIEPTKKCPSCGCNTLSIELGCYEEGYSDFVYCENDCDFTSEVTESFVPLHSWYAFDEILAFAMDIERDGLEKIEEWLGCSWLEFAEKQIKKEKKKCM